MAERNNSRLTLTFWWIWPSARTRRILFGKRFSNEVASLLITPTVVAELDALSCYGEPAQQTAAHRALDKLFEWSIRPLDLATIQKDIAETFAKSLPLAGLLPGDEFNDGLILAESSLAEIPLLVTSDKHLPDIDETALRLAINDADLLPVSPVHPRRLLRALC